MNVEQRQALGKAVDALNDLKEGSDEEIAHALAEDALCDLLRSVGFGEAADAFDAANERVGFWYA